MKIPAGSILKEDGVPVLLGTLPLDLLLLATGAQGEDALAKRLAPGGKAG